MNLTRVKQFITRYAFAGPIFWVAGVAVGFLISQGWKYAEFRQKSRSTDIEQIRLEKELYERLQVLQNKASSAILEYIPLRDRHFLKTNDYQVQNEYNAAKENLLSLIREYNRMEAKLSNMEGRAPRFLVIPLPANVPSSLRLERSKDGEPIFKWDWRPDPIWIEIENDAKALFQQYGHKFPSDK
jgi:hypothetical protein